MKLVRVRRLQRANGEPRTNRFAFLDDGDVLRLLPLEWSFADALGALTSESVTDGDGETSSLDQWEPITCVPGPASLRDFVGTLQHIRNTRRSRGVTDPLPPAWESRPAFYFANPNCLRSATDEIAVPPGSEAFDFELEIAAVLGRGGRDLTISQAGEAIAGYVLYCDWSARDIQAEERTMQIGQGKGKDAAISLGPWILSARAAAPLRRPDGLDIAVAAYVNDELVTDTRYIGMDWSFEELVAYASIGVDLVPGDVIAGGTTPLGCLLEQSGDKDFRGWLRPGDQVRLTAGPLGRIESTILPGTAPEQWRRPAPGQGFTAASVLN